MNIKEQLEVIRLDPFRYINAIFAAVLSIILAYFVFFYFHKLALSFFPFLRPDSKYMPISWPVLKLFVWVIIFLFVKRWIDLLIEFFFKRGSNYEFSFQDWPQKWIFQGGNKVVDENPPRLVIEQSNSGCLLSKYVWRDFEMNFEMRSANLFGILFRAQNLESYFMLQMQCNPILKIAPHVRIFGNWDVIEANEIFPRMGIDSNQFYRVRLRVQEGTAKIYIEERLVYTWILPTHAELLLRQHGNASDQNPGQPQVELTELGNVPKVLFRNKFGMVGFRAFWREKADIKNLQIKSLERFWFGISTLRFFREWL